ncbi:hypothetical protein F8M41_015511 [Gigaspora margarita]|uniref:Peptidase A1 domain-containing protein n=1 Tax=Gigaspora margarita TaxID=4874 RepID=A0A8H4AQP0_GIGMA|nr:hypothetical protein F8M41_015511 [Gigaspora margarita]
MNFSRIKNKWHFIFYCVIIIICCLEFSFLFVFFKPFNQKYINFNRNVIKKHKPKNHLQDLFKKYNPKIFDINQDGRNEGVNINITVPPAGTLTSSPPLSPIFLPPQILSINTINTNDTNDTNSISLIQVEIGSNLSLSLNVIPDISSNYIGLCSQLCYYGKDDSCNNRIDYFDSLNSTTFNGTYKTELINYLDGSNVSAVTGFDYITLNNYTFKDKTLLSLFVEMNGTIETQSAVEVNDDYLQVIGIALPHFICSIGSIAFGGIDLRYIYTDPPELHYIPTLSDTDYPTITINMIWVNKTPLNFPAINAPKKTSDGNWIVPDPVDITFDVTTNSGLVIGIIIPSFLTCIRIATRSENFCPIPGPTGVPPVPPQTTILPKPTQTFPPPQILNLNRFKDNQSSEFLFQVQIGSNPSQALNIMLDTCINNIGICSELCYQSSTGSCNNRQHIFNSKNSSSFKLNNTAGSISYLDGSFVKGLFGNDFITLGNFGFIYEFSFLLISQISGALQAESNVEGIMGVGLSS